MIARVMVDSPVPQLDRLFDYSVPAVFSGEMSAGIRVRVPIRSAGRIADGLVVEVLDDGDPSAREFTGALSEIEAVVSAVPVLAPEVWAMARRVADRSAGTASDVIRLAVPKRQVRVEKAWLAASRADVTPFVAVDPPRYDEAVFRTAIEQRRRVAVDAVPSVLELPSGEWVGHWAVTMAAAATRALASGGSAILAVPDFRDQAQLVAALSAVLPADRIVHLDARQSNPDRYRALLACLGPDPLVIVGNRSVVYAPAASLALIAIWDDGDPLHAEPLSPYVHTRDAALVRQEQQGSALMFFAHSRSTEVERLVELGFLARLSPVRAVSPKVVPTAQQAPQDRFAAIARIPSSAWRTAREALETGPVLVQVARPGFAPRLACRDCGHGARCTTCDGPLGTSSAGAVPSCHWCGTLAVDWRCSHCEGTSMRLVGQGSVRTADELGRAFPGVRVIVADGAHTVLSVGAEPALVVATRGAEPIAAGGYRAVLLLDGERMLARESLRVGEDCLRSWCNAAALAATGGPVVLVGVGGALASAMVTWRPDAYAAAELVDRRRLRFPPAVRLATVTGTPSNVESAIDAVRQVESVDVLGPVDVGTDPAAAGGAAAVGALGGGAGDGLSRAIVRFDYAHGSQVATTLRAAIVTSAASRRRRLANPQGRAVLPTLRVRFDDPEPFVE